MEKIDYDHYRNLRDFLQDRFASSKRRVLFKSKSKFRTRSLTYAEVHAHVRAAGKFFDEIGVAPRDKILIIGPNSPQWASLLLAGFYHARVVVPADVRSSPALIKSYCELVKPKMIFATRFRTRDVSSLTKNYLVLEDLFKYLAPYLPAAASAPVSEMSREDLAEIVFTSGTTGTPKGVMLTHGNILANLAQMSVLIPAVADFQALSILPLSHMYEQIAGLLLPISIGGKIGYVRKVNSPAIKKALNEWKITHLTVVPQILKNLYRNLEIEVEKRDRKRLFSRLNHLCRYLPFPMRKLIFYPVHRRLGGNIRFITSGGAKLDLEIGRRWENMGFKIMEGYGATEVTAGATGNRLDDRRLGSVGRVLPEVEIKIDDNGEILIRGANVSPGYFRNPEKTRAAFTEDGWYRSGDVGRMVDGRLYLSGRDAFKIVLSSGENVYVEDLESVLNQEAEIWESCVIALETEGRERVHAVIIPARGGGKVEVEAALKRANRRLEPHEQILSHSLWEAEDFPRTPTLKIDRKVVRKTVQDLYAGRKPAAIKKESPAPDRLREIVAEVSSKAFAEIGEGVNLGSDLGLDSIDRVELIALLEDEFGVFIDDYAIHARTTVADLRRLIASAAPAPPAESVLAEKYFRFPFTHLRLLFWRLFLFPLYSLFVAAEGQNLECLKKVEGPAVLFFNHIGPLDLFTFLPHLSNAVLLKTASAASENFWKNDSRWDELAFQIFGGAFPVSPDDASGVRSGLERIGRLLDKGFVVCIAPEGRMTRTGRMQPFKRGAGVVASEMGVPVLPIKLKGDYTKVFNIPPVSSHRVPLSYFLPRLTRTQIVVNVGEALDLTGVPYNLAAEMVEDKMRSL
jgi:long-chain acyl-CoA synthetase